MYKLHLIYIKFKDSLVILTMMIKTTVANE